MPKQSLFLLRHGQTSGRKTLVNPPPYQDCEICGGRKAVSHHDDYAKPMNVRWLCRKHHNQWHRLNVAKNQQLKDDVGRFVYRLTIPPDMIKAKGWTDGEPLEMKMTKKGLSIEPIKKG